MLRRGNRIEAQRNQSNIHHLFRLWEFFRMITLFRLLVQNEEHKADRKLATWENVFQKTKKSSYYYFQNLGRKSARIEETGSEWTVFGSGTKFAYSNFSENNESGLYETMQKNNGTMVKFPTLGVYPPANPHQAFDTMSWWTRIHENSITSCIYNIFVITD